MSRKAKPKAKSKPKAAGSASHTKFWPGLIVGGVLAAAAVHFGPTWLKEWSSDTGGETTGGDQTPSNGKKVAGSSAKETATSAKPQPPPSIKPQPRSESATIPSPAPTSAGKASSGPAYFQDPARAANLLPRLGMGESFPGSLLWKHTDTLGWNAFGVLATSGSPVSTGAAAAGNTVTCLLESKRADRVEALRLMANVYQQRDADATLTKFRSFAQAVLAETRCPGTREFLEAIDGRLALQTATADARFTLSQSPLAPGTRWELTVEAR